MRTGEWPGCCNPTVCCYHVYKSILWTARLQNQIALLQKYKLMLRLSIQGSVISTSLGLLRLYSTSARAMVHGVATLLSRYCIETYLATICRERLLVKIKLFYATYTTQRHINEKKYLLWFEGKFILLGLYLEEQNFKILDKLLIRSLSFPYSVSKIVHFTISVAIFLLSKIWKACQVIFLIVCSGLQIGMFFVFCFFCFLFVFIDLDCDLLLCPCGFTILLL